MSEWGSVDLAFFMVVRCSSVSFPNFRPSAEQEMDSVLNAEIEIPQNRGSNVRQVYLL